MRRRDLLGAAGAGTLAGLAGCMGGLLDSGSSSELLPVEERPDAVYVPTHYGGMETVGTNRSGNYECALTYISPHAFWLVTGDRRKKVEVKDADSLHLMPVVWESETGIVPPDINPQVSVTQGGEEVTRLKPWPMLSQRMGFHFGDNVQLGGDGTYRVEVSIGAPTARRTGALADNEGEESFDFELDFEESKLSDIAYHDVPPEKEGTKGAVDPMQMEMMPSTRVPKPDALPGTGRGTATVGEVPFVVTTLSDATPFGGDETETYLAVSPRSPYNRMVVPLMSVSATLKRGGETLHDGALRSAIDPDVDYHYGAAVPSVESGDELTISVDAPPQTARHEGYEMAFFGMDEATLTL
ncbi:iron transporter [Halorussus salinus]|uniref:iron transporter n=1 Tax=Halorussus salinus TaxID=1364935 RepID=UPI001092A112|nr:iron transporter [Halorussus salinus]